jgi:hypothetical protein
VALRVDDRARRKIAERQRRGRDATLLVRVVRIGLQEYLTVDWAANHAELQGVSPLMDGVAARMDERVSAYVREHTLILSAWRWGPFSRFVVVDEPLALLDLQSWERRTWFATHARNASAAQRPPTIGA